VNLASAQEKVRQFMQVFGQDCPTSPTTPSQAIRNLRAKLHREEAFEYERDGDDEVGAADAIGDMLYVVLGTAVAHGIEIEPIFNEIHRSNMTKLWSHNEIYEVTSGQNVTSLGAIGREFDNQYDVKCVVSDPNFPAMHLLTCTSKSYRVTRKDGKVIKSPSYEPAKLAEIIEAQVREGGE
jgi:hypothetical protein